MNSTPHYFKLPEVEELVINWHITEACNYSCRYCYAKWDAEPGTRDIARNMEAAQALLEKVFRFFDPDNTDNPLRKHLRWRSLRLSIAGGEPTLYREKIERIMQIAGNLGFRLSLISNASLLKDLDIPALASRLSVLGVSIDSANARTNGLIGRIDRHGTLSLERLQQQLALARQANPRLAVKVNTVVNALNVDEDLAEVLLQLQPERWKVLRVLPIIDASLAISDAGFAGFLHRHKRFASVMAPEDNALMTESYLMIDPLGRFFQNAAPGTSPRPYRYSSPILEVGAEAAFGAIHFSPALFASRYAPSMPVQQS